MSERSTTLYRVVSATEDVFTSCVEAFINDGWQIVPGAFAVIKENTSFGPPIVTQYQAVTKVQIVTVMDKPVAQKAPASALKHEQRRY